MFAAAGDQGAYDVFGEMDNNGVLIEPPSYSVPLSVDYPASDPAITAAGGTTLGGSQTYLTPIGSVVIVRFLRDRAAGPRLPVWRTAISLKPD